MLLFNIKNNVWKSALGFAKMHNDKALNNILSNSK